MIGLMNKNRIERLFYIFGPGFSVLDVNMSPLGGICCVETVFETKSARSTAQRPKHRKSIAKQTIV